MRVISKTKLRDFWSRYPDSEGPLSAWYRLAEQSDWGSFAELRATFANSADQVGDWTVFNIGGNKYRLIVKIEYDPGMVFVGWVLTHRDYNRWQAP
jgi:mRNA interferase HigB